MRRKPGVFLDKDGTLLEDVPFNVDPALMRFAPGAETALRQLATLGMPLIVVSNQPGVGLGRFDERALKAVGARLERMFASCGAVLTAFCYCPHAPQSAAQSTTHVAQASHAPHGGLGMTTSASTACACRKPAPGLLLRAAEAHAIDLCNSWMVGDILDDIEAGNRAGCRTILIDNGNETEWCRSELRRPDLTVARLDQAAQWIAAAALSPDRPQAAEWTADAWTVGARAVA
jgi:D-glycero-D-manno-heptose 1,7-bisphosphate phosphatase